MKTKEELLKKYEGTEFYDCINAHYGSKVLFRDFDCGLLNFDENAMKDIVGAEKLTYPDFIDIQIQTGKNYRGGFMLCYYYCPMEFKGEVEKFGKGRICFSRIFVDGMFPDGVWFEDKEEHVWMSIEGFEDLKVGDCVSFFAEPYRYIKTGDGKKHDFGLRKPTQIKKIEKYDLPTDDDLLMQYINQIICESCYLSEQCSRMNCIRNQRELKELRKSMMKFLKDKK